MNFISWLSGRLPLAAASLVLLQPSLTFAQIDLKGLDACGDIARVVSALENSWPPSGSYCREASSSLEKALMDRGGRQAGVCILKAAPVPLLEGFTCIAPPSRDARTSVLDCFRRSKVEEIEAYKRDYEKLVIKENAYLAVASACKSSNGSATHSTGTLLPPLLAFITKFELGFASPQGKGRTSNSLVQHGFASVDPSIRGNTVSAIEYISFLTGAKEVQAAPRQGRETGRWVLRVDVDGEVNNHVAALSGSAGVPVWAQFVSFDLSSVSGSRISSSDANRVVDGLMRHIISSLRSEGFRAMSNEEYEAATGGSKSDLPRKIMALQPYGRRQYFANPREVELMMLLSTRPCTNDDRGAYGALAISQEPEVLTRLHQGSISLVLYGLGDCSRNVQGSRAFIRELIGQTTDLVSSYLEKR
ncbi:hypothetical protein SAMN05518669_11019 [Variovorax sp. YR634]|uniref:hypothetical protein n=1 Tax=Variovorax sp. YR634 TaxID=1884385 RepID=UPI00089CE4BC|nr:hypothetical protein [Variovorax sp. YR634]SDY19078.1 hypothetical protein SAMN05518669_11019 [Variovorax sp. YR634]